jgi:hypothetical protein
MIGLIIREAFTLFTVKHEKKKGGGFASNRNLEQPEHKEKN